jgi:hypothetical protein
VSDVPGEAVRSGEALRGDGAPIGMSCVFRTPTAALDKPRHLLPEVRGEIRPEVETGVGRGAQVAPPGTDAQVHPHHARGGRQVTPDSRGGALCRA